MLAQDMTNEVTEILSTKRQSVEMVPLCEAAKGAFFQGKKTKNRRLARYAEWDADILATLV